MKVDISIIMGVHNSPKKKCIKAIESIKHQTYQDWEFLICDDGSTDDTFNFLKKITKSDNRIKILSNSSNRGLASALNTCLKKAKGKFIARMDDDDISLSDRLQIELEYLKNHPQYGFVSTNYIQIGNNTSHVVKMKEKPTKQDFLWTSPFLHPATMFRKDSLVKVGGYHIAKETWRAEDYDLFMRMYALGMYGYNIQIPLYEYYVGQSAVKKKSKYIYRIYEAKIRFKNFKKLGFPLYKIIIFSLKPLIIGLLPKSLIYFIRTKK